MITSGKKSTFRKIWMINCHVRHIGDLSKYMNFKNLLHRIGILILLILLWGNPALAAGEKPDYWPTQLCR